MLSINVAQLKSDIGQKMKGTSVRSITDFYAVAGGAANRMTARIDPQESTRIVTLSMPFFDNIQDYILPDDYKRMIDIRPQANLRQDMPGGSEFAQTDNAQFSQRLAWNSFAIRWNNMIRTLRAQRLPAGNVVTFETFDVTVTAGVAVGNSSWIAEGDASGLYAEPLNYVQGNGSMGVNLSGATGSADILSTNGAAVDTSAYNNEDYSMIFFYIPVGFAARFTSFELRRGDSASAYYAATATTKGDGTAFSDGWNFLSFNWSQASKVGSPVLTGNTYRRFKMTYDVSGVNAGVAINGCLFDSWTNSFGQLYEIEYYSEYMFRSSTGTWKARPDSDTDLVNIGTASYEIFQAEMMVDISGIIRTGAVQQQEITRWNKALNGDALSRWVKTQQDKGLYNEYISKFPSRAIVESTSYYEFDT